MQMWLILTDNISLTSRTRFQSSLSRQKALQGIFCAMRPLRFRIVVKMNGLLLREHISKDLLINDTYIFHFWGPIKHRVCTTPTNIGVKFQLEWVSLSLFMLELLEVLNLLGWWLDLGVIENQEPGGGDMWRHTLTASVRTTATTSMASLITRLSVNSGLYSQMAVAVATAEIFVISPMNMTLPRFTTWPRQLRSGWDEC